MNYFSGHTITFLWTIMYIFGEYWHSATLIGSGEIASETKRKELIKDNHEHGQPFEYVVRENSHILENSLPSLIKIYKFKRNTTRKYSNMTKEINNNNITLLPDNKGTSFTGNSGRTDKRLNNFHLNHTSKARFLEIFNMVEFEHVICTSSDGLEGVCLHNYECEASGGTDMGECADGYGTCCVAQFSCDGNSSVLLGWFTNPGFPSPTSELFDCTFSINKASEDIKQLRVDFKHFEMLPPTGGSCKHDQFIISGQNINNVIPILCGINNGQHAYVEVEHVNGPFYFTIQTLSSASRLLSIKITQLTDYDELAAPSGCLQYFKEPEGYIQSFNYFDPSEFGFKKTPSYLNNLNYAICIERAAECCSVTYSNPGNMQIINYDTDGLPVIPPNQAGVDIFNCPSDWLLVAATRICGERFNDGSLIEDFSYNAPITDTSAGPIIVWFKSDTAYVGRGFKLEYQQNRCSNFI